jgi:hypothetical protein
MKEFANLIWFYFSVMRLLVSLIVFLPTIEFLDHISYVIHLSPL